MPEIISCPDCGRQLRVPDHLYGKKVRCPGCKVMFRAEVVHEPPPEAPPRSARKSDQVTREPSARRRPAVSEEYTEEPPPRRRRRDEEPPQEPEEKQEEYPDEADEEEVARDRRVGPRAGWEKTRLGVHLYIVSIWVWLGMIAVGMVGGCLLAGLGVLGEAAPLASMGVGAIMLGGVLCLGGLARIVLMLVGHGYCMAVPNTPGTGVRGLAIATFALAASAQALSLIGNAISFASGFASAASSAMNPFSLGARGASMAPGLLSVLCVIASYITFCLFLRAVAGVLRRGDLARSILVFLISSLVAGPLLFVLALVVGMVSGLAILSAGASGSPGAPASAAGASIAVTIVMLSLAVVALAVVVGMFAWYITLLLRVRGALDRYIRRA
jgi:hypothetical protein